MLLIYQEIGLNQAFLSKMPENGIKLLNWFIDQMRSKPSIKISIKDIMISTGIAESTLHRWIAKFKKWGIIEVNQLYGPYSHNTFTLKRTIFKYAKYFKYQLESLKRYLFFVYKREPNSSETPYIENKVINKNIIMSAFEKLTKRLSMKQTVTVPRVLVINDTVKDITRKLNLTILAQLKLLMIPEFIVKECWEFIQKSHEFNNIDDKFPFIISACKFLAKEKNVKIDRELFHACLEKLKLLDNRDYYHQGPIEITNFICLDQKKEAQQEAQLGLTKDLSIKDKVHPLFAEFF